MHETKQSGCKWRKTPFANLLRFKSSDIYFAWIPVCGKLIRRSPKTYLPEEKFVIDQRRFAIGDSADFGVAAARVKLAGTSFGVPGVETDGVGGPGFGDAFGFFETAAADSLALPGRRDGHREKIEGFLAGREITAVYGPRFLGGETQGGNDFPAVSRHEYSRTAHGEKNALFSRLG
jgi:hypothetical protein